MKRFGLAATVALVAAALLWGCVGGTDNGDGTSKTMSWALDIANPLADAWNPDHKLTHVFGWWVDENGELDEQPDNPAWGIFYSAEDDSEGYGVLVHYDEHTDSGEGPLPEIFEELGDYTDGDVQDWMRAAIEKMEDHSDPLDAYDYGLLLKYSDNYDTDVVAVYFFAESDKDTDYDVGSWDPWSFDYFENYYALVILGAETDTILWWSWP